MKKILILITILCCGSNVTSKDIYISGIFTGAKKGQDSLRVCYWNRFLHTSSFTNATFFFVPFGKNGDFQFKLTNTKDFGRLLLVSIENGTILDYNLVEPEDSIDMSIHCNNYDDFTISFSGPGSLKYTCSQSLRKFNWQQLKNIKLTKENFNQKQDSLLSKGGSMLNAYKLRLTDTAFEILKLDIIGRIKNSLLTSINSKYAHEKPTGKIEYKSLLSEILTSVDNPGNNTAISFSKDYVEYLYNKTKTALIYERDSNFTFGNLIRSKNFEFKDLYEKIKATHNGLKRDILLTYCITSIDLSLYFGGSDANDFTACLENAINIITQPYLRTLIQKKLATIGKGAQAYDFSLPDSSGNMVNLHDFRGKIVFIDIWFNPCTGCFTFKDEFHEKVYPKIKNNPDVVIISIGTNKKKSKWIQGIDRYSNWNFINLYTAGLGHEHPFIKHYDISGVPYLLLIDRNGKIFSGTVPYTEKGEELLSLMQEALKKKI